MSDLNTPKAFISYSHTSDEHVDTVIKLADRLVSNGVDIELDKWTLKEGQDKYAFMEKMVTDESVTKVLMLSDKRYAEKADNRKGGVGTESQIISKQIYDEVDQDKFIPVVFEYDENGEPYLPTFLKSRIYIDFSSPMKINENYEKLLRNIFDKPSHVKPELGKPPKYILSSEKITSNTWGKLESFKTAIYEGKDNYMPLAKDYLNDVSDNLKKFSIKPVEGEDFSESLLESIKNLESVKDELLEFLNLAILYKEDPSLYEYLFEFFEGILKYNFPLPEMESYDVRRFENFKFFNHELFIYLIAFLIKYKRFNTARRFFLEQKYFIPSNASLGRKAMRDYSVFYCYSKVLEEANKKSKRWGLSPTAVLFNQRATFAEVSFDDFMQADFVLFVYSMLHHQEYSQWYPISLVYAGWRNVFEIFLRVESEKGKENLKELFGVESTSELKEKFDLGTERFNTANWSTLVFESSVSFKDLMNYENL